MALIITPNLEKYLDTSDEMIKLLKDFLTIWKERGTKIDVIKARRIFTFMVREDQKKDEPNIFDHLVYNRHSWVVGEYAADLVKKLLDKHPDLAENELPLAPKEMEYAGGSHDIAKLLLRGEYQYAHEHLAYLILMNNGCQDLASLVQPHHPGSETVLRRIHEEGDFLDITEEEFCGYRQFPFASDLIMLADMSCYLGYDGPQKRMGSIRKRYPPTAHLVIGINNPDRGASRVLSIKRRVQDLLS